jgi:hypothetical protein
MNEEQGWEAMMKLLSMQLLEQESFCMLRKQQVISLYFEWNLLPAQLEGSENLGDLGQENLS